MPPILSTTMIALYSAFLSLQLRLIHLFPLLCIFITLCNILLFNVCVLFKKL
ncbi:hypothetical protein BDF19DRAFT_435271 [Syncephalis fuscata]|nr:hypothetical protein BDF19DRAFT_435271 [Syncephalis fuscata]